MKTLKITKTSTTKFFTNCSVALLVFFALGCGSDENGVNDCVDGTWTQLVANEIAAYSAALTAYQNDPSAANCAEIKATASDYLEALRDALDCVPTVNQGELNSAINEAQTEVNDEDCD